MMLHGDFWFSQQGIIAGSELSSLISGDTLTLILIDHPAHTDLHHQDRDDDDGDDDDGDDDDDDDDDDDIGKQLT